MNDGLHRWEHRGMYLHECLKLAGSRPADPRDLPALSAG